MHDHMHSHHRREAIPEPLGWNDIKSALEELDPFTTSTHEPAIFKADAITSWVTVIETAPATTTADTVAQSTEQPAADNKSTSKTKSATAKANPDITIDSSTHKPATSTQKQNDGTHTGLPESIVPTSSAPSNLALQTAAPPSFTGSTTGAATSVLAPASASSSTATAVASNTMGAAGIAGLVIGLLLGIGSIVALAIFCVRNRKKKSQMQRLDDEKFDAETAAFTMNRAASARTAKTASTAPRLSLRPITQFMGFGESRTNDVAMSEQNSGLRPMHLNAASAWDRPSNAARATDNSNPFGDSAAVDSHNANGPPVVQGMGPGGPIMEGVSVAGAAVGLARSASKRENTPKPLALDFTKSGANLGPPSPAGTEFSMTSEFPTTPGNSSGAAAIAAAGGPQNSFVHRVQLDFHPSMEDELDLQAGQLIRLLHEYDDGWALCIRLDRSKQGVVPRTCLSTRPVKPRQNGGPRGPPPPSKRGNMPQGYPGQGPPPPNGSPQQRRPGSASSNHSNGSNYPLQGRRNSPPLQQRPGSAQSNRSNRGPGGPQYRPMNPQGQQGRGPSNGQGRPRTPQGSNGQSRSASPAGSRRNSPPLGPSGLSFGIASPVSTRTPPQVTSSQGMSNGTPLENQTAFTHAQKKSLDRKPVPGQAL